MSTPELARLLGLKQGSVRNWDTGHRPRHGFELERRKDGASVWWRVVGGGPGKANENEARPSVTAISDSRDGL